MKSKKGGLEISINAIVILILAITVLGIGLAFIRGMFKDTIGQLGEVSKDIENQMIEKIEEGEDRLTFLQNDIDLGKNEKKDIYFGVRNDNDDPKIFDIEFKCESSMEEISEAEIEEYINFNYFKETKELEKDEIMVLKAVVEVSPNAVATTYMCSALIDDGDYDEKTFYVTVAK